MEFKSANAALKWAYQVMASTICKTTSIYAMSGADAAIDLTAHEKHGQAALIVGMVERAVGAGSVGHAYLTMQYGRSAEHIDVLVRYVAAGMPTGIHSRRGLEKCIRNYCGQQIGISAIRTDLKTRKETALEVRRDVFSRLDVLHRNVMDAAEASLREAKLILEAA